MLVAHDLATVRYMAHWTAVMYLGRIVEVAPADALYREPRHPYTRALLAAAPRPAGARKERRSPVVVDGELPGSVAPPFGCPFHPRCAHPAKDDSCTRLVPLLKPCGQGHFTACVKDWERASQGG